MGNLDDKIALATRHVTDGRRVVENQKKLIAELRGGPQAVELLKAFEKSQAIFEGDLYRLLNERPRQATSARTRTD